MNTNPYHFPRPTLSQSIADDLLGKNPLSDANNGLFLAADRRTGKSEFLEQDLKPELERRKVLVIYVDLIVQRPLPPAQVIAGAVARAVEQNLGSIARVVKNTGATSIGMKGVYEIDPRKIGQTDGLSLHQALELLRTKRQNQPIALIIDEAQEAAMSQEGMDAMWALKSARDQLRAIDRSALLLVMSGSHRDKLMRLVDTRSTPFYGSQVTEFPKLGDDFLRFFQGSIQSVSPEIMGLPLAALSEAFKHYGHRPQNLIKGVQVAVAQGQDAAQMAKALLAHAEGQMARDRDEFTTMYLQFGPLEQAVLRHLLEQGGKFKAFDAAAMAFYSSCMNKKVNVGAVQRALEALRTSDHTLVWKSLRSEYSVYDSALPDWYEYLKNQRQWPPQV